MTEERILDWLEDSGLFLGSDHNNKQSAIDKLKEIASKQERSDGQQDMRLQTSLFDSKNAVYRGDLSDTQLVSDIITRNKDLVDSYNSRLDSAGVNELVKIETDFDRQEKLTGDVAWEADTINQIDEKLDVREIDIINDAYDKVYEQTKNLKDLKPLEHIFRSEQAEKNKRAGHYNTAYHLITEASPSSSKINKNNFNSVDVDKLDELRSDIQDTSILTSTDKTQLLEEIELRLNKYKTISEAM